MCHRCGKKKKKKRKSVWSSSSVAQGLNYYGFMDLFIYFVFLGLHLWQIEVPREGVESELQLPAYVTATASWDPSHACDLHHGSWQCRILNPLRKARDQTCILMNTNQACFCWATTGIPDISSLKSVTPHFLSLKSSLDNFSFQNSFFKLWLKNKTRLPGSHLHFLLLQSDEIPHSKAGGSQGTGILRKRETSFTLLEFCPFTRKRGKGSWDSQTWNGDDFVQQKQLVPLWLLEMYRTVWRAKGYRQHISTQVDCQLHLYFYSLVEVYVSISP